MIGADILDEETQRKIADSMSGNFDIGEQDPIEVPAMVGNGGGRDPEQATDELLTPRASQDPTMAMSAPKEQPAQGMPQPPGAPAAAMPPLPQAPAPKKRGFDWSRAFWAAGGGDMASFDAERNRIRDEPYKRQEFEQQQALKQEQLNAYSMQRQKARDAIDPGSKDSLAAQQEFSEIMGGRARQLAEKHPALAAEFEAYAKKAPTMHAIAIEKALKSPRMAEVLRQIDSESRNELAGANLGVKKEALGATMADRSADNSRQWAQVNETKRHNQAVEAHQGEQAHKIHLTSDQQKLVAGITNGINQIANIDKVLPETEGYAKDPNAEIPGMGKSGIISGRVQDLKQMVNSTTDPKYTKWKGTIQRLFSVEKKQFAGVTVTPAEMESLRAMIPDFNRDSEAAIAEKLRNAREFLKTKIENDKGGIKVDANGNPIDPSLILKQFGPGAAASVAGNPVVQEVSGSGGGAGNKPPAPPAGTQPGLVRRNKNTGAQWKWDGADWQAM